MIADGDVAPDAGDPEVNSSARMSSVCSTCSPGRDGTGPQSAAGAKSPDGRRGPGCATYTRTAGVRHLLAAYELGEDKLYGHIKPRKTRTRFCNLPVPALAIPARYQDRDHLRQLQPAPEHGQDARVGTWATANNVEIAYTPTNSSWLNRIEAQFTALRYFALDGTDHANHKEQASMIRRYIIWRNNHAYDERLRRIVDRANVA